MQLTDFSRTGILAVFALATFMGSPAGAKDGRDFAGHYSLTNVTEKDGQVELTLALDLFNYSGMDLKEAVVMVHSSLPGPESLGTFAPVKIWHSGRSVVVSRQFTISALEYRQWTAARMQPPVFVRFNDEAGQASRGWAQISRRPFIPAREPAGE